jgi:hypothetical protein
VVLRNEYGVRIGYAGSDPHGDFVEVNNERFFYAVENNKEPSITIYKKTKEHPLAVCELNLDDKDMLIDLGRNKSVKDDTRNSLLMTLCWYLFQPAKTVGAKKEKALEYSLG